MNPAHRTLRWSASAGVAACVALFMIGAVADEKKVNWAQDVLPILSRDCTGADCHGAGFRAEDLDLETDAYKAIFKVKSTQQPKLMIVAPKSAKESYLWHKISGTHKSDEVKGKGETMPLSRGMLEKKDLEKIKAWIEQGAGKD